MCDKLNKTFLAKFFPQSKTTSLRDEIKTFSHREGETSYEAWLHLKAY